MWAEVAKGAKVQAEHAGKESKANTPLIEVMNEPSFWLLIMRCLSFPFLSTSAPICAFSLPYLGNVCASVCFSILDLSFGIFG